MDASSTRVNSRLRSAVPGVDFAVLSIEFSNRQTTLPVDTALWERLLGELYAELLDQ